ncbi:uncharacterized protein [Hyperolius riggenbachi]|uniref:uncharacterized protein isoform X2 n=1 Tax=Hyperolius riggenbachi TaxID=752182 RepID=UPI0035A38765
MTAVQSALILLLCGFIQCLECAYHVRGPRSWTVGVPEVVTVEAVGPEESLEVQVSLFSYHDRKVTYDSQKLQLSSVNHHKGSLSLLIRPEDFPRGDEEEKFVYLVVESKCSIKEEKIAVVDNRRSPPSAETKPALKKLKRDLRVQIDSMASNYRVDSVKQCCLEGSVHYGKQLECHKRLAEIKTERRLPCSMAFASCCIHAKNYFEKGLSLVMSGGPPRFFIEAPRSWIVGEPQNVTVEVYDWWEDCPVTISLLSYPDRNVTFDSQKLILTRANQHQGNITLLIKTEDFPKIKKFAYLLAKFSKYVIETEVFLTEKQGIGNYTYYSQIYNSSQTKLEHYIQALEDLEFDDDIWRDVDGHVGSLIDLDSGNKNLNGFKKDVKMWSTLERKTKDWKYLQSKIVAWRDLESRNRAWIDLQRNMTALVGKYEDETAKQSCWSSYQSYLLFWECPEWLSKEDKECCFYTREYFHNLVSAGHVNLASIKHGERS